MCGIFGKFSFSHPLDIKDMIARLDLIRHRGPDGFGFEYGITNSASDQFLHHNHAPESFQPNANYFLGHRRLSIVDLNDNAFQPMQSSCGKYSVIFNGEIYNYVELKEELLEQGCQFNTDHSDTEVLLNAYKVWGEGCLEKFRGMFAFAIFDKPENRLFVARDRIGQKTLYFQLTHETFSFASELTPIIADDSTLKIDKRALNLYITLGYVPHPYCIYEGISKLPPASYAFIDLANKDIKIEPYWDISEFNSIKTSLKDAQQTAEEALKNSVTLRLRSDVTVGAFISGGTDSTLIVKNIAEISGKSFDVYGADFPNTPTSEKKYIEEAAQRYKQNLKLSSIDLSHIQNISDIVDVFDEPFDGASSIALFDLFKVATNDHKVILSGDGGDEMFAGYERYFEYPAYEQKLSILRKLQFPRILLKSLNKLNVLPRRLKILLDELDNDVTANFSGLQHHSIKHSLLKPEQQIRSLSDLEPFASIRKKIAISRPSLLKALQYIELKSILPGRMLYKLDRFSMFYGVEARSPFLDHILAETAFKLDDSVTTDKGIPKALLKYMLLEDFDSSFVYRDKQGFGNPLSNWFSSTENQQVFDILKNPESTIFSYVDFSQLHKNFPQIRHGYSGNGEKELWRYLVLAHFLEKNHHRLALQ